MPDEAAKFRLLLQQGGDQPIPADALADAIKKTEELRQQVPAQAVPPAANQAAPMVMLAPPGGNATYLVAGIPVGPMTTAPPRRAPAGRRRSPLRRPTTPGCSGWIKSRCPWPRAWPWPRRPDRGGISTSAWKWLGPGNIGGRTRSIVIHPGNPNIMWLGAVGGGVWKSIDGGTSWAPLADFMANLNVACLVIDPTNPNVLYAGTGEGYYNGDALRGNGIFKTTNGGANWTQLASTTGPNFFFVNRLAMSPNGQVLLAATRSGMYRSTNGGSSFTAVARAGER